MFTKLNLHCLQLVNKYTCSLYVISVDIFDEKYCAVLTNHANTNKEEHTNYTCRHLEEFISLFPLLPLIYVLSLVSLSFLILVLSIFLVFCFL